MFYSLRRHRTWGLGTLATAATAWLALVFQSCAIAATLPQGIGDNNLPRPADIALEIKQQASAIHVPDCPPAVCHTLESDSQVVSPGVPIHLDTPDIQPVLHVVEYAFKRAARSTPLRSQQADYLPPHPLVRFCVLRI